MRILFDDLFKQSNDSLWVSNRTTMRERLAVHNFAASVKEYERERIIDLLIELKAIRRDAFGELVAFNTDGTEVIYLTGLEETKK